MLSGNALNPVLFFHAADSTWYLLVFDDGIRLERIYSSTRVYGGYVEATWSILSRSVTAGATWVVSCGSAPILAVRYGLLSRQQKEFIQ
jgi:hypothetical protein